MSIQIVFLTNKPWLKFELKQLASRTLIGGCFIDHCYQLFLYYCASLCTVHSVKQRKTQKRNAIIDRNDEIDKNVEIKKMWQVVDSPAVH